MNNPYLAQKDFADGNSGWVVPLTFDRARIIYGPTKAEWLTNGW